MGTKVLFIAHHFPPMGGPGTNRSVQFVNYLTEMGYDLTVLTITEEEIRGWLYPEDRSLLDWLPKDLKIVRIPTGHPKKFRDWAFKYRIYRPFWFLLFPFLWEGAARWPKMAFRSMKELIEKEGIELIYTSSGPYAPMQLAAKLKRATGVKWVADMRDPYTDAYAYVWPSKIHWYFSRIMERIIFRKADKLIVNTPEVRKLYLKRNLVPEEKIEVITNGF